MNTKHCPTCNCDKSVTEFNKNSYRKDGLQTRCRLCDQDRSRRNYHTKYKEQTKARLQRHRKEARDFLIEYRQGCKCNKCGESRWYVLDFHHIDEATKKADLANMLRGGWSIKTIKVELAKCIVLCANCHREEHHFKRLARKE